MKTHQVLIDEAYQTVDEAFKHYANIDFMDKEMYADWLAQTYYYVHHVTRILAFAAAKCDLYQDEVLHFRLIQHLKEEMNHDKMLLNDMKNLGVILENYPEKIETRNFYQSLFYMIETYGPYSLMGYFLPQEGLACLKLPPLYKSVSEKYGMRSAIFLKEHCELDVEHFGDALDFFKTIPANKIDAIRVGMFRSAELYALIMLAISERKDAGVNAYWKYSSKPFLAEANLHH